MRLRAPLIAAAILATTLAGTAHAQSPAPAAGGAAFGDTGGLVVATGALLGDEVTISGTLPNAAGSRVRIERLDPKTGAWTAIARDVAGPDGAFSAVWDTDALGAHELRAVLDTATSAQAPAAAQVPSGVTTVFRKVMATWYGPGFWGRKTACGVKLAKTTLGVAHKTLPCGTQVTFFRAGRAISVPVIDRGPFSGEASFDLTQAAAQAIGMLQTEPIGWVRAAAG